MPPFEHIKVLPFTLEKSEKLTDHGRARLQISGWASTNAVDRSREVIEVGFFDASLERFMLTAAMPWMHDIGDPQGRWDSISPVEGKGYYVTGHVIDLGTDVDARRMALIEEGLVRSLSVGFNAEYTADYGDEDEEGIWHWRRGGELIEVSPCTVPCNPEAGFELAKSLGMAYQVYEPRPKETVAVDDLCSEEAAQAVLEEARFEDDLARGIGGLQAVTNIVRHWAKHGRTLTQEHRERLTTARESLAGLLEPHPTSAADAAPQGALSLPRVRGIALPHRAPVQLPRV